MEQIVVKSEVQPNGEVLLFYLDENEVQQLDEDKLLSFQNLIQQQELQPQEEFQEETYIYGADDDDEEDIDTSKLDQEYYNQEIWTDEEHRQLLVFYVDNKETFVNGTAKKKRLWEVACQTMITSKSPESCAMRLLFLREAFSKRYIDSLRGLKRNWPFYDLCLMAFKDDEYVLSLVEENKKRDLAKLKNVRRTKQDGVIITKQVTTRTPVDEKVKIMLNSYMQLKSKQTKEQYQKSVWDSIAAELGDTEGEYWHRRFLNLRTHYIRLLDKRAQNPDEVINWPYFQDFEKMYENDITFHRKFNPLFVSEAPKEVEEPKPSTAIITPPTSNEWNDTEITVLVKYYFDCFNEFQDPSIPNKFLWMEVSRLLDKEPNACMEMYEKLKNSYFEKRVKEVPDVRCRTPLEILFDNIVAKETEIELVAIKKRGLTEDNVEMWKAAELDDLVKFFYERSEMFKDPVLYYVCWAMAKRKLKKNLASCKHHWEEITDVYKSIIKDKMDNPEKRVQWRYPIDMFDKIFDYGNNVNLLDGFEQLQINNATTEANEQNLQNGEEDPLSEIDDTKSKRGVGDPKVFKILDYYLKNKEKFLQTSRKQKLWEALSKEVSISATELDHRFRNLKQVYTYYVQREINKPEMPILWPYYAFCKKVFGYRALKNKMKNSKSDKDAIVEWLPKDLKQLINFITKYPDPKSLTVDQFSTLAKKINKNVIECHEKYVELCKNYRKLKALKTRNPNSAVSWKYYNILDEAFSKPEVQSNGEGDIEMLDYENVENILSQMANYQMSGECNENTDDDYAIIVIPEGKDINDAQIILPGQSMPGTQITRKKWTKRLKKLLLIHFLNYRIKNKGKNVRGMWRKISEKMPDRSPNSCKKMFGKMYVSFKYATEEKRRSSPFYDLLMRVLKVKSKLPKALIEKDVKIEDVELSSDKVMKGLQYYLEHCYEFLSPRFEKKHVWLELATAINEPVTKVFYKINYLKNMYNSDNRHETEFDDILKEITVKENEYTIFGDDPLPALDIENENETWSDDEIDQLLQWYLSNLDKFKSAKYVRKYLWMDASNLLSKSPLSCSKKMTEVRTAYRTMVKENKEELTNWRFYELCRKIYGTGKK